MSEIAIVARLVFSEYRSCHHICELYPHAQVRWSNEQPFDQVVVFGKVLFFPNQQLMVQFAQPLIVLWRSMVANHNSIHSLPNRALFQSWFVDFDPVRAKAEGRDPGLPADIAALFPDSFEPSELGPIPKGWSVGKFSDVADNSRRSISPDEIPEQTPYIALEHMPRKCIALSDWGMADGVESGKLAFNANDILFGKLRPYFHKVGVAPIDGVCSTDIVVITPHTPEWFGFVLGHASSDAFVEHTNAGSTGTKMPRTNWADMARYPVILPPEKLAKAYTAKIRPAISKIIASIHQNHTLATLRDTLLPKLISGEVRVGQAQQAMMEAGI